MDSILNENYNETYVPRKRGRTYMLRLAADMFKSMSAVKLDYAHAASALHCEVLNPHDGCIYEVVILPPKEHTHEHHSIHALQEKTNGNEKNIRRAAYTAEKAAAF